MLFHHSHSQWSCENHCHKMTSPKTLCWGQVPSSASPPSSYTIRCLGISILARIQQLLMKVLSLLEILYSLNSSFRCLMFGKASPLLDLGQWPPQPGHLFFCLSKRCSSLVASFFALVSKTLSLVASPFTLANDLFSITTLSLLPASPLLVKWPHLIISSYHLLAQQPQSKKLTRIDSTTSLTAVISSNSSW